MKKQFKFFIVASLAIISTFTACKKTLNIQPTDQISSSTALSTQQGVEATVVSIYAILKGQSFYGNQFPGLGEAMADNGQSTGRSGRYVNESQNASGASYSNWSGAYSAINNINLVLNALPGINVPGFTQAQKDAYTGELSFLRALYYFDLVKTYAYMPTADVPAQDFGGVPLLLAPVTTIDQALATGPTTARATITAVYKQIYADLTVAMAKIPPTATAVSRATALSAEALFSRVALYNGDYATAVTHASNVIAASTHVLLTPVNYVAGFRATVNPESLFEVTYASIGESLGVNVSLQTLCTTLIVPGNRTIQGGFGDLVPTSDLLNQLGIAVTNNGSSTAAITARSGDVRNLLFELGSKSPYYVECTKYIGRSFINTDNVPVIRISEMYLNRAEANAKLGGNDALAIADDNAIRTNRGLAPVAGLTGAPLIAEILAQRRLEFAFEGHRFLDLKRNGMDINKQSGTIFTFLNTLVLPSIPINDVNASLGVLKNNPGYGF
jgi:hypothetical protein